MVILSKTLAIKEENVWRLCLFLAIFTGIIELGSLIGLTLITSHNVDYFYIHQVYCDPFRTTLCQNKWICPSMIYLSIIGKLYQTFHIVGMRWWFSIWRCVPYGIVKVRMNVKCILICKEGKKLQIRYLDSKWNLLDI